MDEIDDIEEQYKRRNRARELRLESLGNDHRFSSRNDMLADLETAWIMGAFRHAPDPSRFGEHPWTDEVAQTLAVQTHKNALATWLMPIYDRYVSSRQYCRREQVMRQAGVPTTGTKYCPVRKCVESAIFISR